MAAYSASKSFRLGHFTHLDAKSFVAGMLVASTLLVLMHQTLSSKQQYEVVRSIQRADTVQRLIAAGSDCDPQTNNQVSLDNSNPSHTTADHVPDDAQTNQVSLDNPAEDGDHAPVGQAQDGTIKRSFHAYGQSSVLFVHMGSYRGGADSFAVIGLGAKPAHVYGNAGFECEWVSSDSRGDNPIKGKTEKFLPDWNLGRQYTAVVVNCSFHEPVGTDRQGGMLIVYALYGWGSGKPGKAPERFVALMEKKGEYDAEKFQPPYPYDFVYCGSPLYGDLNAQRLREWLAYHVKLFGKRAHFFLHNAGGVTASVEKVLLPWQKLGYVTMQDIREQEGYDGLYHNQFMVLNDCLHRTRFLSTWTFFFDVDEYLYVGEGESLMSVMQGLANYTQVIFPQKPMAYHICAAGTPNVSRDKWGFEELLYRNVKAGVTWERKYALQPRSAFTVGVHRSDNILQRDFARASLGYLPDLDPVPIPLCYYHFHNTITSTTHELCTTYVDNILDDDNARNRTRMQPPPNALPALEPADFYDVDGTPYRLDTGLQQLAFSIKDFERQHVGTID